MRVLRLKRNPKYNDYDVATVLDDNFCTRRSDWKRNGIPAWPEPGEILAEVPDDSPAEVGWSWDGAEYHEGPTLARTKADKREEIAESRWQAETGGLAVNGMTIATDRESQALITGAALQATIDASYTCQWKTAAGFVTLDATAILAVAQAVREHVQESFDREAELAGEVGAAVSIEAVEAIVW
jgi:hypothetical protein